MRTKRGIPLGPGRGGGGVGGAVLVMAVGRYRPRGRLVNFSEVVHPGMRNPDTRVAKALRQIEAQDTVKTNQRAQRIIS